MKKSETIKELALALAKAQAEIKPALLDKVNPHFKSKYASLGSVVDACQDALSKYGFSVLQTIRREGEGEYVVTTLLHASGEWMEDDGVPLLIEKNTMQGLGSAVTYARRYGLVAFLRIVDEEDDDGNGAETTPKTHIKFSAQPTGSSTNINKPVPISKETKAKLAPKEQDQVDRLTTKMNLLGLTREDVLLQAGRSFNKAFGELTYAERETLISSLTWNPDAPSSIHSQGDASL